MPQDDTSISRSSTAAAHSVSSSINPDGKEYESYGEWDAYLSQFIKTYFPRIIQDDLYVTPQQVFAVTLIDDSGDTDKEKKSFRVPDASLRFRKAEQLHFEAFKARYLNDNPGSQVELLEAVQSLISWDLADGWIPSVQMDSLLAFVEIKPGASWKRLKFNYRMFDDCMETWIWEFFQHLVQACDQAHEQAQYFFKKNPDRDSVVVFATAGFKWCWRVFERSEIGDGGPFVVGTFEAPSSDPSFGSSPASAKSQEKSGKRRPRVSTDSQPSHPDNTRPAPKRTKISDGSSSPSNSPDPDPQADVSQSTGSDPSETTDDSAAGSPEPPFIASDSPDQLNVIPQPEGPTIFEEIWQTYMDNRGCFRDVICGEVIKGWSPVNNWGTPNSQGEEEKAAIAMVRSQPKRIKDLPVFRTFLLDHGIDLDAEEDSESDEED